MDDIGLHPAFSEPARQPEAVTPGLIGNDNALKRPTRFCGLVPPTLQKPEQRVPIRLKLLQRLAVNPGHDPCHDPCHEPACLAHLDHHNQGAILLKGSEGSAQVVRLWLGGTSSVLSSDDRASPLAAPHSIYSLHLGCDRHTVLDTTGAELRDPDQAWAAARAMARNLMSTEPEAAVNWLTCSFSVTGESGVIVLEMPFIEVVEEDARG